MKYASRNQTPIKGWREYNTHYQFYLLLKISTPLQLDWPWPDEPSALLFASEVLISCASTLWIRRLCFLALGTWSPSSALFLLRFVPLGLVCLSFNSICLVASEVDSSDADVTCILAGASNSLGLTSPVSFGPLRWELVLWFSSPGSRSSPPDTNDGEIPESRGMIGARTADVGDIDPIVRGSVESWQVEEDGSTNSLCCRFCRVKSTGWNPPLLAAIVKSETIKFKMSLAE